MITVVENKDFVECVFRTKDEAETYYSAHPSRETCRIIELDSKRFPVFITEIGYGNLRYFTTKKTLIDFLRELDVEALPKHKVVYSYIYESGESGWGEKMRPTINLYRLAGPFRGEEINCDYMGMMNHEHLEPEWVDTIIRFNSLKCVSMEENWMRKVCGRIAGFFSRFRG